MQGPKIQISPFSTRTGDCWTQVTGAWVVSGLLLSEPIPPSQATQVCQPGVSRESHPAPDPLDLGPSW